LIFPKYPRDCTIPVDQSWCAYRNSAIFSMYILW